MYQIFLLTTVSFVLNYSTLSLCTLMQKGYFNVSIKYFIHLATCLKTIWTFSSPVQWLVWHWITLSKGPFGTFSPKHSGYDEHTKVFRWEWKRYMGCLCDWQGLSSPCCNHYRDWICYSGETFVSGCTGSCQLKISGAASDKNFVKLWLFRFNVFWPAFEARIIRVCFYLHK